MASTLTVDNIVGATSSSNIHIPGHVVQVQQRTTMTHVDSTSSSWAATDISVSITPTYVNSKVLVIMSGGMHGWAGSNTTYDQRGGFKIYRRIGSGSFAEVETSSSGQQVQYGRGGEYDPMSITYLDSPATTDTVTYTVYFRRESGSLTFSANRDGNNQSSATAMEIAQ